MSKPICFKHKEEINEELQLCESCFEELSLKSAANCGPYENVYYEDPSDFGYKDAKKDEQEE